jgi:hypothetical protein
VKRSVFVLGIIALVLVGWSCAKKDEAGGRGGAAGGAASGQGAEVRGRGWLAVKGADFAGHEIRKAGAAEKVAVLTSLDSTVELAAGVYDVLFGQTVWKNVEVKAGETTTLVPGSLVVQGASLNGHDVVSVETGVVQGTVSSLKSSLTLVPGRYLVKFGPLEWPVEIAAGQTATLRPGHVEVIGAHYGGHAVTTAAGIAVGQVSNIQSSIPLPPGDYLIEIDGQKIPFSLKEAERRTFERK